MSDLASIAQLDTILFHIKNNENENALNLLKKLPLPVPINNTIASLDKNLSNKNLA